MADTMPSTTTCHRSGVTLKRRVTTHAAIHNASMIPQVTTTVLVTVTGPIRNTSAIKMDELAMSQSRTKKYTFTAPTTMPRNSMLRVQRIE